MLLVDKPKGLTSHDIVDFIRTRFGLRKVGHGGTLDSEATGVLVILLGKATKLFSQIIEMEKEYIGSFYLGKSTDTKDGGGRVIKEEKDEDKIKSIRKEDIEKIFHSLKGEFQQIPPMFSALHYKGKRLYELARKDKIVERKPRWVKISVLELLDFKPPLIDFYIICFRGTYIRSLCDEISSRLNIPVYLYSLRRIRCGNFLLENAISLDLLMESPSLNNFLLPHPIHS